MDRVTSYDIKKALHNKHIKDFFLTECKSGSTWLTPKGDMKILDALAIRKSWEHPCFTGYEVKVSRGDFLRDSKFYTYEELCNCLYVVCPKGLIERTELPESVGLIYYSPETKNLVTKKKAIYRKIEYSASLLLYIIYSRLDSDRLPFYSSKAEYIEMYLADKEHHRELGRILGTRLAMENKELLRKLQDVQRFMKERDRYNAVYEVLRMHNILSWNDDDIAEKLNNALSKKYPPDIINIRLQLEGLVNRCKRIEEMN